MSTFADRTKRTFEQNIEALKEARKELRVAKIEYIDARDRSLEYDKTSTWDNPNSTEPPREYLVVAGRKVIDLKHTIKMIKFKMKRQAKKARKEVA